MTGGDTLRWLIRSRGLTVAPGVFDCVSAMAAAAVGFEAIYVGSYATAASMFGVPDVGLVGRSDIVDQVWRIAGAVEVPIIADAEGGFGNPVHVGRTVREFERAGAAAIHLEDQEFGKHVVDKPTFLPLEKATDKIRAAVDARTDPAFLIIARTDCLSTCGLDHAVERAASFSEAGADGIFIAGLRLKDAPRVVSVLYVPLVSTSSPTADAPDQPIASFEEIERAGVRVVLYHDLALLLAYESVVDGLTLLKERATAADITLTVTAGDLDRFLGVAHVKKLAERYGVASTGAS